MSRTIVFENKVDLIREDDTVEQGITSGPYFVTYDVETLRIEAVTVQALVGSKTVFHRIEKTEQIEIAVMFLGGREFVRKECAKDRTQYQVDQAIDEVRQRNQEHDEFRRREYKAGV